MKIKSLDHIVLTVTDIEKTTAFYVGILGMELIRFGEGRTALKFGDQKINLHLKGQEFKPNAAMATVGSADLCFISEAPLIEVEAKLLNSGIRIEVPRVERSGALGPMESIYVRDPDGNLIELSNYKA